MEEAARWWYESESDVAALMAAMGKRHRRSGREQSGNECGSGGRKVGCIARVRTARVGYRTPTEWI
jgi:hypothetical protein